MNPGMKLGPFVIEKEIGSGAMGAVYRAQYRDKNLRVAIKVMAPGVGSSETAQARFQREAEVLKRLDHPNIVKFWAAGRYKHSPFYAMEFIDGETLDATLERRGRLPWEEVVRIGQQLCAALQYAHDQEIIHRDLKPSNLMVLSDGTIKLTDFGIAKALDMSGLTATNCTVGTASYMSPEQCKGERDITHKSDLYSMGVLFYELVTGKKPFFAESTMDMFMQHLKGKFRRPSELVPEIPVWLDNLICQLLAKKPDERPASARVVGQSLAEIQVKVEAQQSAGLERATARGKEKGQHRPRMDEADREAARTMLSKRKKKKRVPFYEQGWFTLLTVAIVLGGLGYAIYYFFFVPPSLEALYNQTRTTLFDDNFDAWRTAKEGPLATFQAHYAEAPGLKADQMRAWSEDVNGKMREHQLLRRLGLNADSKEEKLARLALDYEEGGDLDQAISTWKELGEKFGKDPDPEKRAWGWVGNKRNELLQGLIKQWIDLDNKVAKDKSFTGTGKEEQLAVDAFRAQAAGKTTAALEHWEILKKRTMDDDGSRNWYLLAVYEIRDLKKQSKSDQGK